MVHLLSLEDQRLSCYINKLVLGSRLCEKCVHHTANAISVDDYHLSGTALHILWTRP